MTIEEFIEKCQKRPLPSNPIARVRVLARELAEGVTHQYWDFRLTRALGEPNRRGLQLALEIFRNNNAEVYFQQRWQKDPNKYSSIKFLLEMASHLGFLSLETVGTDSFTMNRESFNLLEEANPATIFISYSRNESSPFALYTLEKLKQAGLDAFLDIDLKVGEEWHGRLQKQIEDIDIFVVIVGESTLESEYVQKEIRWAKDKTIYPIWESSFVNKTDKWADVPDDVAAIMQSTQAIEVPKEHPQHYLTAITQLLNRFGITP